MSKLRVVKPGEPDDTGMTFADACRSGLESALAKGAVAVCIIYETPEVFGTTTIPAIEAVERGLVAAARDQWSYAE